MELESLIVVAEQCHEHSNQTTKIKSVLFAQAMQHPLLTDRAGIVLFLGQGSVVLANRDRVQGPTSVNLFAETASAQLDPYKLLHLDLGKANAQSLIETTFTLPCHSYHLLLKSAKWTEISCRSSREARAFRPSIVQKLRLS